MALGFEGMEVNETEESHSVRKGVGDRRSYLIFHVLMLGQSQVPHASPASTEPTERTRSGAPELCQHKRFHL